MFPLFPQEDRKLKNCVMKQLYIKLMFMFQCFAIPSIWYEIRFEVAVFKCSS